MKVFVAFVLLVIVWLGCVWYIRANEPCNIIEPCFDNNGRYYTIGG